MQNAAKTASRQPAKKIAVLAWDMDEDRIFSIVKDGIARARCTNVIAA